MRIISPQFGPITLTSINADNLHGPILPGSQTYYAESDFGSILIQQYQTENYGLRFGIFNLIKKLSFFFKEESYLLKCGLLLKGTMGIKIPGRPNIKLKESDFFLHGKKDEPATFNFENSREYQVFEVAFSENPLKELFEAFPSLKEIVNGQAIQKDSNKIRSSHSASPEMRKIIHDLLRCPYDDILRKLYFENKVKDFLFESLVQAFKTEPATVSLSRKETDAIYKVREIILTDLANHYSIKELSKKVELNEFKLKTGFKDIFGTGIFECLTQARMEKARHLLLETDIPMKEIASMTGFDYLSNFITSFTRHFGHPPGQLRRMT